MHYARVVHERNIQNGLILGDFVSIFHFRRGLVNPGYGIFILPGDGKLDIAEVEEVHVDAGDSGPVDEEGAHGEITRYVLR